MRVTAVKNRKPCSEETKLKIRLAQIGKPRPYLIGNKHRVGIKLSDKHKQALIDGRKNMVMTEGYKKKISDGNKGKKNTLGKHWKCSEEAKKRMSEGQKGKTVWNKGLLGYMSGEKNYFWKGGITFKPYPIGWNNTFKEQIRYRDRYTCQVCGVPEIETSRKLCVHHIDYNKSNLDPTNLVACCTPCHARTNLNRPFWMEFFRKRAL